MYSGMREINFAICENDGIEVCHWSICSDLIAVRPYGNDDKQELSVVYKKRSSKEVAVNKDIHLFDCKCNSSSVTTMTVQETIHRVFPLSERHREGFSKYCSFNVLDKMFSLFGTPRYSTFVPRLCGSLSDISVKSASWSNCPDPHETHQISYSQPWKDLAADFMGPLRSSKYVFLL